MCIENGIHYFDDNYMHGLCNNKINKRADSYDTGAGFYINASKFNHTEIKTDDYILHYGHGSWVKKGYEPMYDEKTWISINEKYWHKQPNKKIVYTCITGEYDNIIEPKIISDDFDYVCFTDNVNLKSNIWQIKQLPEETKKLSQVKKQRYVKLNPHLFFENYDISIWVDGNVEIVGDLNEFINEHDKNDCPIFVPTHPSRNCIYAEENAVLKMRKDVKQNTEAQINRYSSENFPKNYGLLQSNILLRKHNDKNCIKMMNEWWDEVKNGSHRDQLSFNYVSWKNPDINVTYLDKKIYDSKWFKWHKTHKRYIPKINNSIVKDETDIKPRKTIEELKKDFEKLLNKIKKNTTDEDTYLSTLNFNGI